MQRDGVQKPGSPPRVSSRSSLQLCHLPPVLLHKSLSLRCDREPIFQLLDDLDVSRLLVCELPMTLFDLRLERTLFSVTPK